MVLLATIVMGVLFPVLYLCYDYLWGKQLRLREKLSQQGIDGPTPSFLYGNIPDMKRILSEEAAKEKRMATVSDDSFGEIDYSTVLFPYFERWKREYGPIFMYSRGSIQMLYVTHPDLIKEIGQFKSLDLGRPTYMKKELGPLFGDGILASNGAVWAYQRRVISPELFLEKVKGMMGLMVEATVSLLELWESQIESQGGTGEVLVDEDLRNFSADVISRACFGSSYIKGKEIFSKLRHLQRVMAKADLLIGIPGMRYLPTKSNRELWRIDKEIRLSILNVVKERKEEQAVSNEKDLLQSILENASVDGISFEETESFIVDNCKNIYFAGHETTAISAAWCLMLLSKYPKWQALARAEVMEICRSKLPDFDMLKKMKILTMVIHEALRLYPPAVSSSREALEDIKLKHVNVPKGTNIWIPIAVMHHDPEIWGPDANEFNPERFSRGISGACKLPHAYLPFGLGTRTCLGQNFAMMELKIVISLILSRLTFSLSPKYCHSPAFRLIVEPEFGVYLNMQKYDAEEEKSC